MRPVGRIFLSVASFRSSDRIPRQYKRAETDEVVQVLRDNCHGNRQLERLVLVNGDIPVADHVLHGCQQ